MSAERIADALSTLIRAMPDVTHVSMSVFASGHRHLSIWTTTDQGANQLAERFEMPMATYVHDEGTWWRTGDLFLGTLHVEISGPHHHEFRKGYALDDSMLVSAIAQVAGAGS